MLADSIKSLLLGGTTYYPISDADTTLSMQGKTWSAHPKTIVIDEDVGIAVTNAPTSGYGWRTTKKQTVECIAKSGSSYAICGTIRLTDANFNTYTFDLELGIVGHTTNSGRPAVLAENWGVTS